MPSPACTVNGSSPPVAVAASATVVVALANHASVSSWSIVVSSTDDTHSAPTLTIDNIALTATFTAGSAGASYIFQSSVNNGRDQNQNPDPSLTTTFKVYVPIGGNQTIAANETTEGNATAGWTAAQNNSIRSFGSIPPNAITLGAHGDGTTDDSSILGTILGTTADLRYPPATYLIGNNATLGSAATVQRFDSGAILKIAAGKTLTIGSAVNVAENQQIIDVTASGASVAMPNQSVVRPEWFGAKGDGVTDDTAAIRAAATVLQARGGGTLLFRAVTYLIFNGGVYSTPLGDFTGIKNIRLIAEGATLALPASVNFNNPTNLGFWPCFKFTTCEKIVVDGFTCKGGILDNSLGTAAGFAFVDVNNGCKGISMPFNRVSGAWTGLHSADNDPMVAGHECTGVQVGYLEVTGGTFGISGRHSLHEMTIDYLKTTNVYRSLFIVGIRDVHARVDSADHAGGHDVLVYAQDDSVSNVHVHYIRKRDVGGVTPQNTGVHFALVVPASGPGNWSFTHCSVQLDVTTLANSVSTATSTGTQTLPAATFNVSDTTGYASAGTFVVGGQFVQYTGKTGTTFTGCTGGSGTIAPGTTVGQNNTLATAFQMEKLLHDLVTEDTSARGYVVHDLKVSGRVNMNGQGFQAVSLGPDWVAGDFVSGVSLSDLTITNNVTTVPAILFNITPALVGTMTLRNVDVGSSNDIEVFGRNGAGPHYPSDDTLVRIDAVQCRNRHVQPGSGPLTVALHQGAGVERVGGWNGMSIFVGDSGQSASIGATTSDYIGLGGVVSRVASSGRVRFDKSGSVKVLLSDNSTTVNLAQYDGTDNARFGDVLNSETILTGGSLNLFYNHSGGERTGYSADSTNGSRIFGGGFLGLQVDESGIVKIWAGATQVGQMSSGTGDFLKLGSTTNVAASGRVRLDKAGAIQALLSDNTTTANLAQYDGSDNAILGDLFNSSTIMRGGTFSVHYGSGNHERLRIDGTNGTTLKDDSGNVVFQIDASGQVAWHNHVGAGQPTITGALSAVTDANAKAVMTSIIASLSGNGYAVNGTT